MAGPAGRLSEGRGRGGLTPDSSSKAPLARAQGRTPILRRAGRSMGERSSLLAGPPAQVGVAAALRTRGRGSSLGQQRGRTVCILMLTICCAPARAFTTGDCAIVGFNMDSPDDYAVLLLDELPAGMSLTATDAGVDSSGTLRTNEDHKTYTPTSAVPTGTVLTSTEFGSLNLPAAGDQVLVYTGDVTSPTFICALNDQDSAWATTGDQLTRSYLPPGLVDGVTAISMSPEVDNAVYDTTSAPTSGTPDQLRAAIHSTANWITRSALTLTRCLASTRTP